MYFNASLYWIKDHFIVKMRKQNTNINKLPQLPSKVDTI